jgi:hypothetical protein
VDEFQSDGTFKATHTERLKMRWEGFTTNITKLLQSCYFTFGDTILANTDITILLVTGEYDESTADLTSRRGVVFVVLINLPTPLTTKL